MAGLGTDLRLTLQSLQFRELWSGLWMLLAAMLALEALLRVLRRRWAMPARLGLGRRSVGRGGREVPWPRAAAAAAGAGGRALGVNPLQLGQLQPCPPWTADWPAVAALPWPR